MTSHEFQLTESQAEVIRQTIAEGGYADASQVLDDALRLLVAKQEAELPEVTWLQGEVQKVFDTFERGDVIELDSEEAIQALSADIRRRGRERLLEDSEAMAGAVRSVPVRQPV